MIRKACDDARRDAERARNDYTRAAQDAERARNDIAHFTQDIDRARNDHARAAQEVDRLRAELREVVGRVGGDARHHDLLSQRLAQSEEAVHHLEQQVLNFLYLFYLSILLTI